MSTIATPDRFSKTNQTARPLESLVFKMRPEFRRSVVYVEIAILTIGGVRFAFDDFFPQREGGRWEPLIPFLLIAVAVLVPFRWRLRVDSSGIARRRLFGWDLWPWASFERGKVLDVEGRPTTYFLPEKPFWARKLSLELLADNDRAQIEAVIDRLRVRTGVPLVSDVAFRYGFRKEAIVSPGGILVRERGEETRYDWKQVTTLRIVRQERRRRDFQSLEIVLPDRVVKLSLNRNQGQVIRSWSASRDVPVPDAESLAAFLERFIPHERIRIVSLGDAPLTVLEWHDRRSMLAERSRDLKNMRRILCGAGILLLMVPLVDYSRGIFHVVAMMILCAASPGIFFLVLLYVEREHREEVAKLETQMPDH